MADREIPEAAVQAAAEVMRRYDAEYDPARGRHWAAEAREVLAAALPHLTEHPIREVLRKARNEGRLLGVDKETGRIASFPPGGPDA